MMPLACQGDLAANNHLVEEKENQWEFNNSLFDNMYVAYKNEDKLRGRLLFWAMKFYCCLCCRDKLCLASGQTLLQLTS